MTTLRFDWDSRKAASNLKKHGVSFEEAVTAFFDRNAMSWIDESHSGMGDERFVNLGQTASLLLLFVVHNEEAD